MSTVNLHQPISPASIVVAAKDQVSSDVGGEAVILHVGSGRYYGLAQVGARVWDLLRRPTPVSEIRDTILQEYDVARERCEEDIVTLLVELAAAGLVEVVAERGR